jgi:hypothetical protein
MLADSTESSEQLQVFFFCLLNCLYPPPIENTICLISYSLRVEENEKLQKSLETKNPELQIATTGYKQMANARKKLMKQVQELSEQVEDKKVRISSRIHEGEDCVRVHEQKQSKLKRNVS